MNVLIACEESQVVCTAFRERGHRAFSCDIQECSGGHPEWHIQDDVRRIINGYNKGYGCPFFVTCDGVSHQTPETWDLVIAHPPCTHLAVSGARWFGEKQKDGRQAKAIDFFLEMAMCNAPKVAVENPVCIMSRLYRKPDQIIQPYWFGDHARKATCLWLKGLPPLKPSNIVDPGEIAKYGFSVSASANYARDENGKILSWNDPRTAKARSRTFKGIGEAMAEQWGGFQEVQISLFD